MCAPDLTPARDDLFTLYWAATIITREERTTAMKRTAGFICCVDRMWIREHWQVKWNHVCRPLWIQDFSVRIEYNHHICNLHMTIRSMPNPSDQKNCPILASKNQYPTAFTIGWALSCGCNWNRVYTNSERKIMPHIAKLHPVGVTSVYYDENVIWINNMSILRTRDKTCAWKEDERRRLPEVLRITT